MYLEYSGKVRASLSHFCFALGLLLPGARASAQEAQTSDFAQPADFFSGFIVSSSATEITVNRKGLGKDTAATRKFFIDASTKIEGVLKPRAHVTVRFRGDENGARAVHIIVR